MSPPKYRDRLLAAAARLLKVNGVTGDFVGDLDFLAAVDAVLDECEERTAAEWRGGASVKSQ